MHCLLGYHKSWSMVSINIVWMVFPCHMFDSVRCCILSFSFAADLWAEQILDLWWNVPLQQVPFWSPPAVFSGISLARSLDRRWLGDDESMVRKPKGEHGETANSQSPKYPKIWAAWLSCFNWSTVILLLAESESKASVRCTLHVMFAVM